MLTSWIPANKIVMVAALAVLTPMSFGCATTQMAGQQSDDARITGRVGRSLTADPEVRRYNIDVDTLDRVVTLRGVVETDNAKQSAEQIALNTDDVERVINLIQVRSEETQDAMEERDDEQDQPSDLSLRTKVGAKLTTDPEIRRFNIDVDVQDGVVALSGVVHDSLAKEEAEKLARNVEGVRDVRNELTVNEDDQRMSEDDSLKNEPSSE